MAQDLIGIGAAPDDGNGDPLRTACTKVNDNFTSIWSGAPNFRLKSTTGQLQIKNLDTGLYHTINFSGADGAPVFEITLLGEA